MAKIEPAAELEEIRRARAAAEAEPPGGPTDHNRHARFVAKVAAAGILTPNELRELYGAERLPPPAYNANQVAGQETGHRSTANHQQHHSRCMDHALRSAVHNSLTR